MVRCQEGSSCGASTACADWTHMPSGTPLAVALHGLRFLLRTPHDPSQEKDEMMSGVDQLHKGGGGVPPHGQPSDSRKAKEVYAFGAKTDCGAIDSIRSVRLLHSTSCSDIPQAADWHSHEQLGWLTLRLFVHGSRKHPLKLCL